MAIFYTDGAPKIASQTLMQRLCPLMVDMCGFFYRFPPKVSKFGYLNIKLQYLPNVLVYDSACYFFVQTGLQ
jgi:hypothetical protein